MGSFFFWAFESCAWSFFDFFFLSLLSTGVSFCLKSPCLKFNLGPWTCLAIGPGILRIYTRGLRYFFAHLCFFVRIFFIKSSVTFYWGLTLKSSWRGGAFFLARTITGPLSPLQILVHANLLSIVDTSLISQGTEWVEAEADFGKWWGWDPASRLDANQQPRAAQTPSWQKKADPACVIFLGCFFSPLAPGVSFFGWR